MNFCQVVVRAIRRTSPARKEITSPEAATTWANELNTPVLVVKAQIHAGGRVRPRRQDYQGQGSGRRFGQRTIGKTLVTHQTGPKGRTVHRPYGRGS